MPRTADDYRDALIRARQANDLEAAGYFERKLGEAERTQYGAGEGTRLEQVGAGFKDLELGSRQLMGRASPEEVAEHNYYADRATGKSLGGRLTRTLASATPAIAASLLPGGQAVGGAALTGALTGLIMPTEDENVAMGKLKN